MGSIMCAILSTLNKIDTILVGSHEFWGPHGFEHQLRPIPGICIVLIDAGAEFHLHRVFETDNVQEAWNGFDKISTTGCGKFCIAVNYDCATTFDRKKMIRDILHELHMAPDDYLLFAG